MVQQLLRRVVVTGAGWKVLKFVAQCAEQLARPGKARCIPICDEPESGLPAEVRRFLDHIQSDGELTDTLERGQYAEFSDPEDQTGTTTWLFPLRTEARLVALLSVKLPPRARPSRVMLSRLARLCEAALPLLCGKAATGAESARTTEKYQSLLDANHQLDALSQARSYAVRNTVHDLQTPLVSLLGYSRLMLRGQAGPLTETQREYLGAMLESLQRMTGQVSALGEFAKPEPLRFTSFDLAAVWPDLVEQIRSHASGEVSVEARFSHQPFPITADASVFSAGLKGLIEHVVRRTANGGVVAAGFERGEEIMVRVTTDRVRLSEEDAPAGLEDLQAVHRAFWLHGGGTPVTRSSGDSFSLTVTLPPIVCTLPPIVCRKESGLEDLREQALGSCSR
jgi:signal transduction histidine kinase